MRHETDRITATTMAGDLLRVVTDASMMFIVTHKEAWQEAMNGFNERIASLKSMPLDGLQALPYTFDAVAIGSREARYAVYKEVGADGSVMIVLQLMMPWRWPFGDLGVSTVFADGFRVDGSGHVASLAEGELYDYM